MASLTTPLSVRLSEDDTTFLAGLEVEGAITASDKIRGLIRLARQRAETPDSFSAALAHSHDQLGAAVRGLRILEQELGEHSDVAAGLMAAAEEFLALALTAPRPGGQGSRADLVRYEAKLVDCAARMTEHLLRWAVTPTAPAFDAKVVSRRMVQLGDIISLTTAAIAAQREG